MIKTVLFVPGFQEDETSRNYATTIDAIERCGYTVKFVPIEWRRTTLTEWLSQLNAVYEQYDQKQTILAGFSFGAVAAFVMAARRSPAELWLFSLSPFFAEDIPNIKLWELRQLGRNRVKVARETSFDTLARKITCPVKLFVGSDELRRWPEMEARFSLATHKLANVEAIIVDGVAHDVTHIKYIEAITNSLRK
jgi:pimeloyl-ACP methyl ester carboxylesterase